MVAAAHYSSSSLPEAPKLGTTADDPRSGGTCTLTYANIEEVLGAAVPANAVNHRAWWGNEADGEDVQCRSWLGAGWEVDDGCEPQRGVVRFRRRSRPGDRKTCRRALVAVAAGIPSKGRKALTWPHGGRRLAFCAPWKRGMYKAYVGLLQHSGPGICVALAALSTAVWYALWKAPKLSTPS